MEGPQYLLSLIAALGGGATLRELITTLGRVRSGQTSRERNQNKNLVAQLKYAKDVAEVEFTNRRRLADYAAGCRRVALENGATIEELGHWPTLLDQPPFPESVEDPSTA